MDEAREREHAIESFWVLRALFMEVRDKFDSLNCSIINKENEFEFDLYGAHYNVKLTRTNNKPKGE